MEWEDEQDPEMEDLVIIIDEGVDALLLFKILTTENIQMIDFLSQNNIVIEKEILSSKNKEGLCPIHEAAKRNFNPFFNYLLNQVRFKRFFCSLLK